MTLAEMQEMMGGVLELDCESAYHDCQSTHAAAVAVVNSLTSGLAKSAADVKGYIRAKKAKQEREANAVRQQQISDEVKKTQDVAKAQARKLKEKQEADAAESAKQIKSLFKLTFSEDAPKITRVQVDRRTFVSTRSPI